MFVSTGAKIRHMHPRTAKLHLSLSSSAVGSANGLVARSVTSSELARHVGVSSQGVSLVMGSDASFVKVTAGHLGVR